MKTEPTRWEKEKIVREKGMAVLETIGDAAILWLSTVKFLLAGTLCYWRSAKVNVTNTYRHNKHVLDVLCLAREILLRY